MITRKQYLDSLMLWKDKQVIKIITGIRRCGKSTLFSLFIDRLKKSGVDDKHIIFINFEELENENLCDYRNLHKYIKNKLKDDNKHYIFLDEIQHVRDFQKAIDSLFVKKNTDIYITGSNAHILSGELATLLSGRYIEIEMLPLSFKEYCTAYKNRNKKSLFSNYMKHGGFPYITELGSNTKAIETYLNGIYSTVLLKDVAAKNRISDIMMLESLIRFLFHNAGSLVSSKKITDYLNSNGRKISVNTVENYINALESCYMFYKANRFDIKGKQHLKTLSKYYAADHGLRNILLQNRETDTGHILENIVYLELLRRGYKTSIGKSEEKEIDFIAQKPSGTEYYQVCATIQDPQTLERELAAFAKIKDNFPKYILSMDETSDKTYNGIIQKNIVEWLLE